MKTEIAGIARANEGIREFSGASSARTMCRKASRGFLLMASDITAGKTSCRRIFIPTRMISLIPRASSASYSKAQRQRRKGDLSARWQAARHLQQSGAPRDALWGRRRGGLRSVLGDPQNMKEQTRTRWWPGAAHTSTPPPPRAVGTLSVMAGRSGIHSCYRNTSAWCRDKPGHDGDVASTPAPREPQRRRRNPALEHSAPIARVGRLKLLDIGESIRASCDRAITPRGAARGAHDLRRHRQALLP